MAVAAQSLSLYSDTGLFSQVAPVSNPTLMLNDNGTVSYGSATLSSASGQSLLSNFADGFSFGNSSWSDTPYTPYSSISSFNFPNFPESSSSEVLCSSEDHSPDLLLMGSHSDFMSQINVAPPSLVSTPAVMHPKLVSTLKNMVAPEPASPRHSSSQYSYYFFDQQLTSQQQAANSQHQNDAAAHNPLLHFHHSADLKPTVDVSSSVSECSQAIPPTCSQSLKVEKSESEDIIEAAVVSVDVIQNRRPFRCQHEGCNKTFKNPQTMKMHHKTHYTDNTFKAGQQPLPTLSNSLKAGHNKKIPSRCPKCKKTFVGLYELRRHYGRKHSEGEKPHGCRKCGKRFYIEVDVRDHEKLCGEPIECKCGLKFAFKCNLVAHKKAHPACQDAQTSLSTSSTTSGGASWMINQSPSSSSDSDQSPGGINSPPSGRGTKRPREESINPENSFHSTPLPELKDIPEAPQFKCARHGYSGSLPFSSETNSSWMSLPSISHYPEVPTFSHFNPMSTASLFPSPQQKPSGFSFKLREPMSFDQSYPGSVAGLEMGILNQLDSSTNSSLQSMVRLT